MYIKSGVIGVLMLTGAQPATATDRELALTPFIGVAGAGTEIKKTGGGVFKLDSNSVPTIGVQLTLDMIAPDAGDAGFRWGIIGDLAYHNIKASGTDAALGSVKLRNRFTGTARARVGYDFGKVFPYASLGLGLSDLTIATNGAAFDNKLTIGVSAGIGVEVEFNDRWSAQVELISNSVGNFTPVGGGGEASAGTGILSIGVSGVF